MSYTENPHPAAALITGLYERHAGTFDQLRSKDLMERPWLDRFCAEMPAGSSVLDLGCGSGEPMARHLIMNGYAVTGVDAAPAMVALCRARFPDQRWIEGDMRQLALLGQFGGVLAWHSFFHLPHADQRAMFAQLERHAAPGAALMFTSGPEHGEAIGEFEGKELYHASLAPEEYRALLTTHGFHVIHHVAEDPTCGGATVWLAKRNA